MAVCFVLSAPDACDGFLVRIENGTPQVRGEGVIGLNQDSPEHFSGYINLELKGLEDWLGTQLFPLIANSRFGQKYRIDQPDSDGQVHLHFWGLHTSIHTPETINPPVCQDDILTGIVSTPVPSSISCQQSSFPTIPACSLMAGADFKIFKNRLPKPRNGMSPSRLGCRETSLPLLSYMERLSCQNIRRFRRCSKTMPPFPRLDMDMTSTWPTDAPPWLMAMEVLFNWVPIRISATSPGFIRRDYSDRQENCKPCVSKYVIPQKKTDLTKPRSNSYKWVLKHKSNQYTSIIRKRRNCLKNRNV